MSTARKAPLTLPRQLAEGIGQLDPHQRDAVAAAGNLVILAGPGSGKTRTVVARAGYLLSATISPLRGLAAITYTNQAAAELREGLNRLGLFEPERLFSGTLHSFCLTQILTYARLVGTELPGLDALMSEADVKSLMQECADDEGVNYWALAENFASLRRRIAAGEDVSDHRHEYVRAVKRYEALCARRRIWDFEGIVLAAVRLLRDHADVAAVVRARFPVIVIDEYQDLGAGLHRLVETLLESDVEITAVGDVDQSIFGWAGGAPEYLDALADRDDFTVCRLLTNYRCGSAVVAGARVALAQDREWKANPARQDPGTLDFLFVDGHIAEQAHAAVQAVRGFLDAGVEPHEVAVLLRYRSPLGPMIEQELIEAGVTVRFEGSSTAPSTELGRWLQAAALYATRLAPGSMDPSPPPYGASELRRTLETLARAGGHSRGLDPWLTRVTTLHRALLGDSPGPDTTVAEWSRRVLDALDLPQIAASIGDPRAIRELSKLTSGSEELLLTEFASDVAGTGKVVISTYHGAKGRTFTAVILPGLTEGVVPPWGGKPWAPARLRGEKLAEERRNFYVALTRSRGSVVLQLSPSGIDTRGGEISRGYSSLAMELAAAFTGSS